MVVEWAPFRVAPGVSESAILAESEAFQRDFLAGQHGFIRRELLVGPDGQWVDHVTYALVMEALGVLAARADVIVLAQASMARAMGGVESVDSDGRAIPVLTSPRLGVERLAEVAVGAER